MLSRRPPAAIRLSFDAKAHVLLVRFAGMLSQETLVHLDARLARFVERGGAVDAVFDFSEARADAIQSMIGRAVAPSRLSGRRRVFVTPYEVMQGAFRLYGLYQQGQGGTAPTVVGSLDEAVGLLGANLADFEPVVDPRPADLR